ncbi:sporulation protein YunB [Natroniella sulfidigena]|uniref:sporulation protein YunB n=1 Tax=Natroniella sulfidigena TaxID=723921 RepID=UPI002009EB2B|nr:sporulation protein YunB [Natroniella sulfidigena]MCK8818098.1 sporulation protein YunB [Natroniella sulfidigena]
MQIPFKKLIMVGLIIIIIMVVSAIFLIETKLQPGLHNIYKSDVTGMLTTIINEAVNEETDTLKYNDLVTIQTNREGHIIMMQPNLQAVNDLSSNIAVGIQQILDKAHSRTVEIPLFQIFGFEILSRYSPLVTAEIIPYGYVKTNIQDDFQSAGINQTRHKIYLEVKTEASVVVPLLTTQVQVDTDIPLTEAIIVGQVPEVYVGLEEGIFEEGTITKGE